MPELPEVEALRRGLEGVLIGRAVVGVRVVRRGVVRDGSRGRGGGGGNGNGDLEAGGAGNGRAGAVGRAAGRLEGGALLCGCRVVAVRRHGKQIAIVGAPPPHPPPEVIPEEIPEGLREVGPPERPLEKPPEMLAEPAPQREAQGGCVCVHLGMSGTLRFAGAGGGMRGELARPRVNHVHVVWALDDGSRLWFRDPRRFGGVWTYAGFEAMAAARWARLGPDALSIRPGELGARLARTRRGLKAALLDQTVVAGLGNIYVDELLHACGLHPLTPADRLDAATIAGLVRRMRRLLRRAIDAGGSSLRDYVGSAGEPGGFQGRHRVYGRADLPCRRCATPLAAIRITGRQSTFCPRCQS